MFGLVYWKKGEVKAHEEEFRTFQEAEEFAKTKGLEEWKVIPLDTHKIDFSKGIFDIGE